MHKDFKMTFLRKSDLSSASGNLWMKPGFHYWKVQMWCMFVELDGMIALCVFLLFIFHICNMLNMNKSVYVVRILIKIKQTDNKARTKRKTILNTHCQLCFFILLFYRHSLVYCAGKITCVNFGWTNGVSIVTTRPLNAIKIIFFTRTL